MVEGQGGWEEKEEEEEAREREEGGGGGERRNREEEQGGGAGEGSCCTQRQSLGVWLPPRRPQMLHRTSSTALGGPVPSTSIVCKREVKTGKSSGTGEREPRAAEHWKPSGTGMSGEGMASTYIKF